MGEHRMGICVVLGVLALGACGDEGGASAAPDATTATSEPGVKDGPPPGDEPTEPTEPGDPFGVACTAGGGGSTSIDIERFTFMPRATTVDAGGTVTFTNVDATDHSVWSTARGDGAPAWQTVGSDPLFRLPEVLHQADASTCTFTAPGTYRYLCGVHNSMTGTIDVA